MKALLVPLALVAALGGCAVNPEAAAERRANLMAKVFADPSDRQGLFLVFPLESGGLYDTLLIIHYVNEVSTAEVVRRVADYCAGLGSSRLTGQAALTKELGRRTLTLPDGTTKAAYEGRYDCTAS